MVISGVCGGIGEYLGIDPVLIRLLWVLIAATTSGGGLIAYIIAAIIMPQAPKGYKESGDVESAECVEKEVYEVKEGKSSAGSKVFGLLLILIGGFWLSKNFVDLSWLYRINYRLFFYYARYAFPGILILLGVYLIFSKK